MSEARSVFKIFGSLGPGGSVVTFMEKSCRRWFNLAYEIGDPKFHVTAEETRVRELRERFVNEIFEFKSEFNRMTQVSRNPLDPAKAKVQLVKKVHKFQRMIAREERGRLTRERVRYATEKNDIKYNQAVKKLEGLDERIYHNLKEMALNILKPKMEVFTGGMNDAEEDSDEESAKVTD